MTQPNSNPTVEGRSKQLYVSRRVVMRLLDLTHLAPCLSGLPADAYVSSVHYDDQRQSFCFTIDSMEFEPVAHGAFIPEIESVKLRWIERPHAESAEINTKARTH